MPREEHSIRAVMTPRFVAVGIFNKKLPGNWQEFTDRPAAEAWILDRSTRSVQGVAFGLTCDPVDGRGLDSVPAMVMAWLNSTAASLAPGRLEELSPRALAHVDSLYGSGDKERSGEAVHRIFFHAPELATAINDGGFLSPPEDTWHRLWHARNDWKTTMIVTAKGNA